MEAGKDFEDKLLLLTAKFNGVICQYAESYQVLLNGDVYDLQDAVVSIVRDDELYQLPCDPSCTNGRKFQQLFNKTCSRDHLDMFNTVVLRGLLLIRKNNMAAFSFSFYQIRKEEFLQSATVQDLADTVENTIEMPDPEGFVVVKMTFAPNAEEWPKRRLKEIHSLLKYVYKEYARFPRRPRVIKGILILKWNTPEDTRDQVKAKTKERADFLLDKGCVVSIANESVEDVSVSNLYGSV